MYIPVGKDRSPGLLVHMWKSDQPLIVFKSTERNCIG